MMSGPTFPLLRDATIRSFFDVAERVQAPVQFLRGDMIAKFPRTGAEVIFRSADAPDRLRGPNLSGVYLDEASLMPEDVYTVCIGRLRKDGKTGILRAAFTPQGMGHWTYKVFGKSEERKDPDVGIVSAKTNQNPFLPDTFDKMVRQQYGSESRTARQELDAAFLPEGLTMFARQWFRYHDVAPPLIRRVRAWDLAASEVKPGTDPDYTAGALVGETADKQTVIPHIVRDRLSPLATKKLIRSIAEYDGKGVEIIIEQEPGAAAKILVADLIRDLAGWTVRAKPANGTKAERAGPLSAFAEAGNVALVRSLWNEPFLDEAEQFPGGKHDDQVDAVALGFNHLHEKRSLTWVAR